MPIVKFVTVNINGGEKMGARLIRNQYILDQMTGKKRKVAEIWEDDRVICYAIKRVIKSKHYFVVESGYAAQASIVDDWIKSGVVYVLVVEGDTKKTYKSFPEAWSHKIEEKHGDQRLCFITNMVEVKSA
jgi:hypothetical protein